VALGFVTFGLRASTTYLFNDPLDLPSDQVTCGDCARWRRAPCPFSCDWSWVAAILVWRFALALAVSFACHAAAFTPW
jgi:hypothetical protein